VVGVLVLDRWDVATGAAEAAVVEPVAYSRVAGSRSSSPRQGSRRRMTSVP
jgi:hypothetical protein